MKNKIYILVAGCSIVTAALLLTQALFIYNTYLLNQRQILSEIRSELNKLEREINTDSVRYAWMKTLENNITAKSWSSAKNKLNDQYNAILSEKVNQYVEKNKLLLDYEVRYFNDIGSAAIFFKNGNYEQIKNKLWYGSRDNTEKINLLNSYTLSSGSIYSPFGNVSAELNTQSGFTVGNWNRALFLKLLGILLFSALLIMSIVFMFYVSIKNMIRQKKIADVKTDFVNNITHEFNTPLTALNISIASLKTKKEKLNDPIIQNALSTIERQYKRLKDLVTHATQHSLDEEGIELNMTAVHNQQFLVDAVADFRNVHPEQKISFTPALGNIYLMIDQFQLTTAINNLLDNAAKYGNGVIEVRSDTENQHFKISVTDNGPGIPKGKENVIFDKFVRLENGDLHNTKGLGLGLYYVKKIINVHNGTIAFVSDRGKGTSFTITIPQA